MHIKQRKHVWGSMTIDVSFPLCAVAVCDVAGLLPRSVVWARRCSYEGQQDEDFGFKAPLLAAPIPFLPMIPTVGVK